MKYKSFSRLPNGFGSITKLSGKRRCPFMARPPVNQYNVTNGNPINPKPIGYFSTWREAYEALLAYHHKPVNDSPITFYEVGIEAINKIERAGKDISHKMTSLKRMSELHHLPIRNINTPQLQGVIDRLTGSRATVHSDIVTPHLIYKHAIVNEYIDRDISRLIENTRDNDQVHGKPFTPDELTLIKQHRGDADIDMVIIMIYTGFRISAFEQLEVNLDEQYFKGGVKTEASRDRIVPIHPSIEPLLNHLIQAPQHVVRRAFADAMSKLGITGHTPHDTRHTFSWLCDQVDMNMLTKKILLGHARGNDVTNRVYGHRTLDELRSAINCLPY